MRQRLAAILTVVVAVAVFVAAGYVILRKDPVKHAGQTPGFSLGASAAPSTSTSASATSSAAVTSVVFLGDDYSSASGASSSSKGFVSLLSGELKLQAHTESVEGGGYAKGSSSGGTYVDRVDAIVKDKPDLVVVTGGRNDVSDDTDTLKSHADDLFKQLHEKLPDAKLVAVAPFWGDSDAPSDLAPVASAIKDAVEAAGGTYLDLPDPLNGHPGYMKDASNPNDEGYAAIAAALKPKLEPLLPAT